ncbi:cation diffusion facilitator family transporter [Vibrio agarivorans]|uniref:cation diffusion facilitator family transporter n=1 Tax=Vibrio agarivorans TaxID=153622 RepID=UPI0022310DC8|nr:cation diffusion facilitator family transporter [Vibrio agarivorans]
MCTQTLQNENKLLKFSAVLSLSFAVMGIVLGWLIGSLVIIFDGTYSLMSLLLTLVSLGASAYIAKPSKKHFPFGKAVLEPIVIAFKAVVILALVSTSLYSAITSLFNGGNDVDTGIAVLFGFINVAGCGFGWWYIGKQSSKFSSGLIEAEATQWKMDTLISVAVALGFIIAIVLTQTPFAHLAGYADPIMMLLMGAYFIKVPGEMLTGAMKELLKMSPTREVTQKVEKEVDALNQALNSDLEVAAVSKVGNELHVQVDIRTDEHQLDTRELSYTRKQLTNKLSSLSLDVNLTLNVAL